MFLIHISIEMHSHRFKMKNMELFHVFIKCWHNQASVCLWSYLDLSKLYCTYQKYNAFQNVNGIWLFSYLKCVQRSHHAWRENCTRNATFGLCLLLQVHAQCDRPDTPHSSGTELSQPLFNVFKFNATYAITLNYQQQ